MSNKVADIDTLFEKAESGMKKWCSLREMYGFDSGDLLMILPLKNNEMNSIALEYLEYYMKKKYINNSIILCNQCEDLINFTQQKNITIHFMTDEDMDCIMNLYKLFSFEKNIVVIFDRLPIVSMGIVGKKGITLNDYVINTFFDQVIK